MNWLLDKKYIFYVFPILFAFELIFGYSGTMIMIGGLAIRHILFIASFISLYGFLLLYIIYNRIPIISVKSRRGRKGYINEFNILDWSVVVLIISTLFSMVFVPILNGSSVGLAFDEMLDSVAMMTLYFPISFMIRKKQISLEKSEKVLSYFIVFLSIIHIVLYIGQTLNKNFISNYFGLVNKVFMGTSITPGTVLGHGGYPRVIYSTSIFILIGIYILLKKIDRLKIKEFIFLEIHIWALLTTMTKSIWFGALGGTVIFSIGYIINKAKKGDKNKIIKFFATLLGTFIVIIILDSTIFQGLIGIRFKNSFVTNEVSVEKSEGIEQKSNEENNSQVATDVKTQKEVNSLQAKVSVENKAADTQIKDNLSSVDQEGAKISNNIKIEQTKHLLNKWKEHPILGNGYGSYVEEYIRSKQAKFSYEMQLPALIMKIGIIGIVAWGFFIVAMILTIIKNNRQNIEDIFPWLFLLVSFGLSVQTNPMLLSFTGMAVLLYLSFSSISEEGNLV